MLSSPYLVALSPPSFTIDLISDNGQSKNDATTHNSPMQPILSNGAALACDISPYASTPCEGEEEGVGQVR